MSSYNGFFPAISKNGYGHKNWNAKLPVAADLVVGPQARRWFQRECMLAMLELVRLLRQQKPRSDEPIRVVALILPDGLFSASVDVFWGDSSFFDFFDRCSPYQTWLAINQPHRSLAQEWRLGGTVREKGYTTVEWDEDWDEPYLGELWAIGDVDGL